MRVLLCLLAAVRAVNGFGTLCGHGGPDHASGEAVCCASCCGQYCSPAGHCFVDKPQTAVEGLHRCSPKPRGWVPPCCSQCDGGACSLGQGCLAAAAEGSCTCPLRAGKKDDVTPKAPLEYDPPAGLKIAFLGDAGYGSNQRKVLELVKAEKADFVIHGGDFEYRDDAALFEQNIDEVLGPDYPYFGSIGNHDVKAWAGSSGHKARLEARLERFGGKEHCAGEYGVNMVCNYKGFTFVLSGVGTQGGDHVDYIYRAFEANPTPWRMCNWHKNQKLMQTGGKSDSVGWPAYYACREVGAMIGTHHEHQYSRSYQLDRMNPPSVYNTKSELKIKPGRTWVFVSGLAGKDIRSYKDNLQKNDWWASTGASDDGVDYGAIFCTWNVTDRPDKANCEFKQINGKVWDSWSIRSSHKTYEKYNTEQDIDEKPTKDVSHESRMEADTILDIPVLAAHSLSGVNETRDTMVLSQGAHLRFAAGGLRGQRVKQAFLQVYGAEADNTHSDLQVCGVNSKRCVIWTSEEDELGEKHEVWQSPDLAQVVEAEVTTGADFIELRVSGAHPNAYPVYSGHGWPCIAPHLWTELSRNPRSSH